MRRLIIGFGVTAISVALLARLIDWPETMAAIKNANPAFVALAVVALLASLTAKVLRWRFLLPADAPVSTPRLYRILHISFMLNNVLPARLGDVARIAMTARQPGLRLGHVLSSLLTERVADAVTLLACFVIIGPFLPIPGRYASWIEISWWVLGAFAFLALLGYFGHRFGGRVLGSLTLPPRLTAHRFSDEMRSFGEGLRHLYSRRLVLPVWGLSAIAWAGAFAINVLLMQALDIDAPWTVAVLLTCTTNMAMLIPSSPGYIGVFHAAATLALLPFGIRGADALSLAILAHLANVIPVCLLGGAFLLLGHETIEIDWRSWRHRADDPASRPASTEL